MWGLEINIEVNDFSTLVEVIAPANAGGMLAYWEPWRNNVVNYAEMKLYKF